MSRLRVVELKAGKEEVLARELRRASQSVDGELLERVRSIVEDVRSRGDDALIDLASRYDRVQLTPSELVSNREEMEGAVEEVDGELLRALRALSRRVAKLERERLRRLTFSVKYSEGTVIRSEVRPLDSVGCYAPGGRAVYLSTIVMMGVPASIAGVKSRTLATPPQLDKERRREVLAAAYVAGFDRVLWSGGAQAIAALTYGTQSVEPVRKVVGPGNRYVVAAKLLLQTETTIDFAAGPTELVVLFDSAADLDSVALDIMAQAEHSPDTLVLAVTTDRSASYELVERLQELTVSLPEDSVVRVSLERTGPVMISESWRSAMKFVNALSPEHVSIASNRLRPLISDLVNAGVITMGRGMVSVAVDYFAGASHVLPTGGWASSRSTLSVLDFVRVVNVVVGSERVVRRAGELVGALPVAEGLEFHAVALGRRDT
ncbi:MAG: histidinol dehydrogenase [Thaumarchaeota archaeon]|nr:histidinol dehydrogenase [Candidatus Calditenuaceae archaeon]MDW8186518.1 histidinol dehydrogenase [Nitrososphaerota archaeon]